MDDDDFAMFSTPTHAKLLVWHWKNQSQDGLVRHGAYFKQWKFIDAR
jgi:hypothetical protein